MDAVSSIAQTGLLFNQRRLAQSAGNVANAETRGYEARREVASEAVTNGQPAGVTSEPRATGELHPTFLEEGAEVLGSNTNLISETTERIGAAHAFKANLNVVQAQDDLTRSLLDIKA